MSNVLWHCVVLALVAVVALLPARVIAQAPDHGLMWNRTGLPAVFPLQIKTSDGQDYLMTLWDEETGAPALAAFIEGGRFFKVLVPPGRYDIQLASGLIWQNPRDFTIDDETKIVTLVEPLVFAVIASHIKAGHVVDLTSEDGIATVKDQFICQRQSVAGYPRPQLPFEEDRGYAYRITDEGKLVQFPNKLSRDRLLAGTDRPIIATDFAPYFSDPSFEIRPYPC